MLSLYAHTQTRGGCKRVRRVSQTSVMIESSMAVRFSSNSSFRSSSAFHCYRPIWGSDELGGIHMASRCVSHSVCFNIAGTRSELQRFNHDYFSRRHLRRNRTHATAKHLGSASDPAKRNWSHYHPSEEIAKSSLEHAGDAKLTPAETTKTIIEVNSKATLMLTGVIGDGIHENIIWPDLPYVTDEHGNIYFQVKNDEDILQTIMSDNSYVQVIIGFDTLEMIKEMDISGPAEIDFGIEEIDSENSDFEDEGEDESDEDGDDDDYDEDWVAVLEDGHEGDSDEALEDWAKLETMRSSHPVYFAKRLAEVASDDPVDWMEQPSAGLAIQGLLRPALIEEHSNIQRHQSSHQSPFNDDSKPQKVNERKPEDLGKIDGDKQKATLSSDDGSIWDEDSDKQGVTNLETSFYKLEIIRIQLVTAQGQQTDVEVEDYNRAVPDPIAHAAAAIITRLKDGSEKTTEALRSLCWRCKGIQAEEVKIIGIDSLGFDIRLCSGTQIQTLRVAFKTKATSECSAESQMNDMLFPGIDTKPRRKKQPHQKES